MKNKYRYVWDFDSNQPSGPSVTRILLIHEANNSHGRK